MSELHDKLVKHILDKYPDARASGMSKWYREQTTSDIGRSCGFVPDAWRIASEPGYLWRTLYVYEAQDTSRLTFDKLCAIANFWDFCDSDCIDLRLVVIEAGFVEHEMDCEGLYLAWLELDKAARKVSPATFMHMAHECLTYERARQE